MKRVVYTVLGMALAASVASAALTNEVTSVNVVGYVKVAVPPNGLVLASCGFDSMTGPKTLKSVFGTDTLKQDGNYIDCDRIVLWITAESRYQAYAQYTDGEFYPCNNATEWNTSSAIDPALADGQSFWLFRGASATTTNTIPLLGEVVDAATMQIGIVPGYQMVAYPFSSDMPIADMTFGDAGGGGTQNANYIDADRIIVWEGNHYQQYGLYTDGAWYPCNNAQEWNDALAETDRVISLGEGFWYVSQTAFNWNEGSQYLSNL